MKEHSKVEICLFYYYLGEIKLLKVKKTNYLILLLCIKSNIMEFLYYSVK